MKKSMEESVDKNITIWGDSILKGVIFDETDKKYRVAKNNCVNTFAEITGYKVINNAYFGMTSTKAKDRIFNAISKKSVDKGDIVIVEFGGNDCDFNWSDVASNPEIYHEPKTTLSNFKKSLQDIIDMFKSMDITPILMNLPPLEPQRYFDWVSQGLCKENILRWLGDVAKIYRWQEAYNSALEWVARQNNCKLINVREGFLTSCDYSSNFCIDGIHPSEKGQKRILEAMLSFGF
jgi:lysophospholipase L1-like esterase